MKLQASQIEESGAPGKQREARRAAWAAMKLKEGQAVWVKDPAIAKDNLYNIGHVISIDGAKATVWAWHGWCAYLRLAIPALLMGIFGACAVGGRAGGLPGARFRLVLAMPHSHAPDSESREVERDRSSYMLENVLEYRRSSWNIRKRI